MKLYFKLFNNIKKDIVIKKYMCYNIEVDYEDMFAKTLLLIYNQ